MKLEKQRASLLDGLAWGQVLRGLALHHAINVLNTQLRHQVGGALCNRLRTQLMRRARKELYP